MSKPKIERKVLKIFGKVIKPANWIIFSSGIILIFVGLGLLLFSAQDKLTSVILTIQGVQLMVEGYGEVKDDESLA